MDKNDEIQQEKDIANGWRQKYLEAYERMLEAEAELAELKAKQTYASWGSKRSETSNIG